MRYAQVSPNGINLAFLGAWLPTRPWASNAQRIGVGKLSITNISGQCKLSPVNKQKEKKMRNANSDVKAWSNCVAARSCTP